MQPLFRLLLPVVIVTLSGCGWLVGDQGYFRDRGDDYRKAKSIPPMQVPEGKKSDAVAELYVIPVERTDALLDKEFEVPRPQPIQGNPEDKVVRIQKLGEQQWILLDEAPAESWPRVRNFLISNQIGIEREDAGTGQMETGWLSFKSDATRREKYRFRVEQGVQRNSSEIYVQQMGYKKKEAGEDVAAPEWPAASMDAERETWMIKELANYLASTSGESSVSLLAQGISTVNKVYLVRDASGQPVIDLRLPFDRAWASLGRALDRANLTVRDLDRSTGVYFVKYEPHKHKPKEGEEGVEQGPGPGAAPEEEHKSFFSRLNPWGGDDEDKNPAVGHSYRVEMRAVDQGVVIGVRRDDGQDFKEGEAEFVLGLIKARLS
jgi:outer membrane protein assembly factor BamC